MEKWMEKETIRRMGNGHERTWSRETKKTGEKNS